jgi:hypothetical protein
VSIEPDTKDWTWVLQRPCPECGFDAATLAATDVAGRVRASVPGYQAALARDDAAVRPRPDLWSPLEYSCHVRDVHRLYTYRLGLMLDEDDPLFPNWDQDVTAVEEDYGSQDPAVVSDQLAAAAEDMAAAYDGVTSEQWQRTGRRSDGAEFTVDSFARYFLHDIEHHLHDISRP